MAGTMSREDLALSLKASLHDAADVFVDGDDMGRLLDIAAQDFNRHRPRTQFGTLTVSPGKMNYPAPDDLYLFKSTLWGMAPIAKARPWEKTWPGPMPRVQLVGRELHLAPAPTQHQVNVLGSEFRYYYLGRHLLGAVEQTTIDAGDRFLLLLRAQAEAMRELTVRNVKKPVQLRDGMNSGPRNMTPSAFYTLLMEEWEAKVERLAA